MGRGKAPVQRVATSDEGGWSFRAMGPRYVFGPDEPKWETPDPDDAAAIMAGLPFDPTDPPTGARSDLVAGGVAIPLP